MASFLAPAEKSIAELQNLDTDDEALKRYKGQFKPQLSPLLTLIRTTSGKRRWGEKR